MPIERTEHTTVITGNAVNWYAVTVVLSAMTLYLETGMIANRAYTASAMRSFATRYTDKQYPRSRKGLEAARSDLQAYRDAHNPDEVPRL